MASLPSIKALLAFESAARRLSFIHASKELNVTPGAISRQIQTLEALLDRKLFTRRHKQVELTQTGRDYLAEITAPLQRIADATARFRGIGGSGAISICAYPTVAIRWLIPRWGRFYDRHPNIDLQLTTTLNPVDFERGGFDFAMQVLPKGSHFEGLSVQKLLDVDLLPVCSPAVGEKLQQPSDLAGMTLIHCAPRPLDWHHWLESTGVSGVDPSKGLRFESLNLAFQAAIEGLGVAIGIEALIEEDLAQGRLIRPFDIRRHSQRPFHLVYPTARVNDENFVAFRDWVLEEAEPQ